MATTSRPSTPRTTGLRTQTQTQVRVENMPPTITTTTARQPVLHLRGATREQSEEAEGGDGNGTSTSRRIQWAEDVVDNEGMGKKKSKVCCIYHAPKGIDESSDESSSDSSIDESGDDGSARPARRKKDCGHGDGHDHGRSHVKGKRKERSPNAYEKMPKPKNGGAKEQS